MNSRKSCVVVTMFSESQVGLLDFSYRIKALAKKYSLTILTSHELNHDELHIPGAEYLIINLSGSGYISWLSYLFHCSQVIRRRKPDFVMLMHTKVAPVALMMRYIPTLIYWNEHPTHLTPEPEGYSPLKRIWRSFLRWLIYEGGRKSTLVMPIGEAHRDDLFAHGYQKTNVNMIYMGVDKSFFGIANLSKLKEPNEPLQLIYVGSVQKERGRDIMLEALANANAQRKIAHLTIVGASQEQSEFCRRYAKELGIENAVTIHGRVSGREIPNFFSLADAGLCLWEDKIWWRFNPPTKLFEYLVAGLPVLASNIRTHTQYIADGENGLIFEYDSTSLAKSIIRLWENRLELQSLKQRAAQSGERYLWPAIEPVFLESVKGVAGD